MIRFFILLALALIYQCSFAQLTVQKGFTAQQLGNNLAGSNISIINPVITGDTSQYGLFNFNGTGLGLSSGVILSTGDIDDAVGPNSDGGTSTPYGNAGDADLSALAGFSTQDAVVFEFEFEVQGDELEFNFVFLSEEYNEWVNTGFNDVFAFYISGPGITGQENLAVVPGTTTPVTINSINNNSFWQFYNDNDFGNSTVNVEFDGFTTLMKARKTNLTPCGVYKLSLRIADGSDDRLDSGVLLQENSLVSNSVAVSSSTVSTDTTALEGCFPATFTFDLGATASSDYNIPIRLGGTALNGVDYTQIDSIITIPAGQTSSTVIIDALADGITEGVETVELYYSPSSCAPEDTVVLYINDATSITFDATGTDLGCNNGASGEINVNISGGAPPYYVTYIDTATGVSNTVAATSLPVTGLDASTYVLRVSDQYGCTADAIVVGGSFNAGQTFLPDGTGASYTSDIVISGFNSGQTLNSINQINSICATMEHSYASDLTIELIAPGGQTIQLKNVGTTGSGVNTCDMGEPIASGPVDNWSTSNTNPGVGYQYCWTNNPTYPTMNDMISPLPPGPPPVHTFTTLAGNTYTDYYLPAGSYAPRQSFFGLLGTTLNGNWTLKVTDNFAQDNGYIFDWAISLQADLPDSIVTLLEPVAPVMSHSSVDPTCGLSDGSIDFTVNGNHPPFSFNWSNGATTEDISGLTAGSYQVSVTDTTNCTYVYDLSLSNQGAVTLSATVNNELCYNSNDGSIDLSVGAGTFSYNWSNASTTQDINALAPGSYSVTVSDGSCIAIDNYTIAAANPIIVNAAITQEVCGDQEGEIDISIQGGVGALSYLWSNAETTQDLTDLQQGLYFVTVSDTNSCAAIDSFTVINLVGNCVPACDLDITSFLTADENCADGTGFIDITAFTTSGPISYLWSNGSTTEDLANLSAGIYSITVSDAISCTDTLSFNIINQASGLNIAALNLTNEYCGNEGGAIDALVNGGAQPYSFLWSNGAITEDISGLSAGTYTLTVTDGNLCKYVSTASISNNTGNLTQTYGNAVNEVCSNASGSIDIIFTGGQTPYTFNWSNGANTEDISGLSAGTYTCTVVDNGGCTVTTPSYVVANDAGGLNFSNVDVDDEICNNGLGEITLDVSGGTQPYTYLWNTGATLDAIENLSAGQYTATVTDSSGCAILTGPLNLVNNSGTLSLDAVQAFDEVCGNTTGSINISLSGNTGTLSYLWSNGSNSQDLSNLSAGNYTCTITDSIGCAVFASGTVNNDPGAMSIDNTVIIDENCGLSDASVNIVYSGETAPVSFNWSNGATTQSLTAIQAGNYSITITDAIGCQVSGTALVNNNSGDLSLDNQVILNEICSNGLGSIDLDVSGTATPLTYLWSNGATTQDLNSLSSGSYTCSITDSTGCMIVAGTYNINNSAGTLVSAPSVVVDEVCSNTAGSIDITVSGGSSALNFLWSNGATTEDISGLSGASYSCTISDAAGCSLILTELVNNDAGSLSIDGAQVSDENCTDAAGAIDITVSGGSPTYSYNWSNGATSQDLNALSQGTYDLTITDQNTCALTASYVVNNNSPNFQLSSTVVSNENCGDATGTIDVTLFGGQPNFQYQWSNGATTEDISGLSAGVYTGTVTDLNGCVVIHSSSIQNDPGNLVVMSDSTIDATCGAVNGSIFLNVGNGTPTYSYLWSNGATSQNISALAGGTYTCVISDAAGCTTNYNTTINDLGGNFQLSSAAVVDDACTQAVGSITTTVAGGGAPYNYNWSVASSNPCCSYTLNMVDLNNNGWGGNPAPFVNVYINGALYGAFTVPPGAGNSSNSVSLPVCTGDSIAVEYIAANQNDNNVYFLINTAGDTVFSDGPDPFDGGIAYNDVVNCTFAGQGTGTISNLYAGTYSVTITDTNGCVINQSYQINDGSGLIGINLNTINDEACGQLNGAVNVSVNGASNPTYLWSNGATTQSITGIAAGTYTLTATDPSNGCTAVSTPFVVVNNANGLSASSPTLTDEQCGNGQGAIDVNISGGVLPLSYAWSNGLGTEDIIGLNAGLYTVTVTDSTGCELVQNYQVNNIANGLTATSSVNDEVCGDGTGAIDLTVAGGAPAYTYNWSNGASTEDLAALSAGIYTCSVTDSTGCLLVYVDTIVNSSSSVVISNATINDADCNDDDGDVTLTVTGGQGPLTYLWSDNSTGQNLNNVFPGSYTVTITEANGCVLVDSFVVGNNGNFSTGVSDTVIIDEICNNGAGSIDITGPGFGNPDYLWSNGATTEDIAGLTAGTYTVSITQTFGPGGGCTGIETYVVLNDQGTLSIDSLNAADESCSQANGSIAAVVSGGATNYTYLWSNAATTASISGLTAGAYSLTVTDANGCIVLSNTTNLSNNTFGFGLSGINTQDEQCGDAAGTIDITVNGGVPAYSYIWSEGSTSEDISGLTAGTYTVTLTDNVGCVLVQSFNLINFTNNFGLNLTAVDQGCTNNTGSIDLQTTGGVPVYTYLWSDGSTTEDIAALNANTYFVTVTDNVGCTLIDSVVLGQTINNVNATVSILSATCVAADGALDITPTNGTAPYSFLWSNAATSEDISGLTANSYTVTITDAVGCTFTDVYDVPSSNGTLGLTTTPTAATCGQANGGMSINPSGGTPPYNYTWSGGQTTSSVNSLSGGTYAATVSDQSGCSIAIPIIIPNIGNPVNLLSIDTTDASCALCSDGGIDISLDAAGGPYAYQWSNNSNQEDLVSVVPGIYSVTITSIDGCSLDTTITVNFSTGLIELEGRNISIYPNPSTGRVFVDFQTVPTQQYFIEVFNSLGQLILSKSNDPTSNLEMIEIDLNNTAAGTYMLKISNGDAYRTQPLIIINE